MAGGPSIFFTRKAVVDETLNCRFSNIFKSIVRIDASQLYRCSLCQRMPTGVFRRDEIVEDLQSIKHRQIKTSSLDKMVMSYFQPIRPECKTESFYTTGTQKKEWLIQCRRLLRALQHRVWSHGLFPLLLFLPGSTVFANSRKHWTLKKNYWAKSENSTSKKMVLILCKCGNVSGSHCTRQKHQWSNI